MGGQFKARGGFNTYGPMFNVLYDIPIGLPIYPYVGAGAGYQWTKLHNYLKVDALMAAAASLASSPATPSWPAFVTSCSSRR